MAPTTKQLQRRIRELENELKALRKDQHAHSRKCVVCGKGFFSHRADAKTCSVKCRVALHRS